MKWIILGQQETLSSCLYYTVINTLITFEHGYYTRSRRVGRFFYLWVQTSMNMMNATIFQNLLLGLSQVTWSFLVLLCVEFMSEHYDKILYYNEPCRMFQACLMSGHFPSNYIDSLAMLGKRTTFRRMAQEEYDLSL